MYDINKKIKECMAEEERLKNEIVDFVKLREDYMSGKRDMYEDYPNWRHPFHRTPMDWVNWRISDATRELDAVRDKIKTLTRERAWYETTYYRPMYENDICNEIHKNGFIIGVKF